MLKKQLGPQTMLRSISASVLCSIKSAVAYEPGSSDNLEAKIMSALTSLHERICLLEKPEVEPLSLEDEADVVNQVYDSDPQLTQLADERERLEERLWLLNFLAVYRHYESVTSNKQDLRHEMRTVLQERYESLENDDDA